ncbi:MAG TPA: molybdopterin synthase catalytic subunit MoaE [Methylophilaceae bacterium]|nr:molybdopterin synthase catalytic subunit MoaE [Methylophilaceae bacterium]
MSVRVQVEDFDLAAELAVLRSSKADIGAIVSFIGMVRDINDGDVIKTLTLEHYPGMTEKSLFAIEKEANSRWHISQSLIIHRVGTLKPQDQIVLVAVTSPHRAEAFAACEFIMDYLKTKAPFWKKEKTNYSERWVEAKSSDEEAQARWNQLD